MDDVAPKEPSLSTSSSPQPSTVCSSLTSCFSNDFSVGRPGTSHSFDSFTDGDSDQQDSFGDQDGRVVLRMEVSNKEHSFLIGSGGEKVRNMRAACSCLIHFPDVVGVRTLQVPKSETGKGPYPHLLGNEVSVRGKLPNVIAGLQAVRGAIPFSFSFMVNTYGCISVEEQNGIGPLALVFGIEIKTKPALKGSGVHVTIRGPQLERTLLGVEAVCSLFAPHIAKGFHQVTQSLCISPQSQSHMFDLCDAQQWLRYIGEMSRVQIAFPNPSGNNGDKETVTLTGSVRSVAAAWIILMSMMPVTLRVFLNRDSDYQHYEHHITKTLGVSFFPPKKESGLIAHPYVELRTIEGNLANLCKAYHCLVPSATCKIRICSTEEKLINLNLGKFRCLIMYPSRDVAEPPSQPRSHRKPTYFLAKAAEPFRLSLPQFSPAAPWATVPSTHFSPSHVPSSRYNHSDILAQAQTAALQAYSDTLLRHQEFRQNTATAGPGPCSHPVNHPCQTGHPLNGNRNFLEQTPKRLDLHTEIDDMVRDLGQQVFIEQLMRSAVDNPPSPGFVALNMRQFF